MSKAHAVTLARRGVVSWGLASAALLAACGPHVRPGTVRSSGSSVTSDSASTDLTTGVRIPVPTATPVPTPLPATTRPPNPAALGTLWFDPTPGAPPKDGGYDAGFWRRESAKPGSYWFFVAPTPNQVSEQVIAPNDLPVEPPRPAVTGQHRVVRVRRHNGTIVGYWVWDAGRRAGPLPAPRWEWVGDGRPFMLAGR